MLAINYCLGGDRGGFYDEQLGAKGFFSLLSVGLGDEVIRK